MVNVAKIFRCQTMVGRLRYASPSTFDHVRPAFIAGVNHPREAAARKVCEGGRKPPFFQPLGAVCLRGLAIERDGGRC